MYRKGEEYDRMAKLAIEVLLDYGVKDFPLNMDDLCRKMHINVVPYSAFGDDWQLLYKKSIYGFSNYRTKTEKPTIYFNDIFGQPLPKASIESTKGHEVKHILEDDEDDSEDDLCEYFSKYLRCPFPLVLYWDICTPAELISTFAISNEQATYVISNYWNRKSKYGDGYFQYEIDFLREFFDDPELDLPLAAKKTDMLLDIVF